MQYTSLNKYSKYRDKYLDKYPDKYLDKYFDKYHDKYPDKYPKKYPEKYPTRTTDPSSSLSTQTGKYCSIGGPPETPRHHSAVVLGALHKVF